MKPQGTQLLLFETRSSSDPFAVRVSPRARRLTARVHVGGRVEIVVPIGVNARAVREFVQRFSPWIDRKVAAMQCVAEPSETVPQSVKFALTAERFAVAWRRALLQSWLKRAARERLAPRLARLAGELNFKVPRIAIRRQRTRWGSCSTRGTLSLNCSLVFLGPEVVRYLFVHELAHTRHMNHSASFWYLVEKLEPDYRRLDRELLASWRTVPLWVFKS
jgi:predicted metal-dependent hydrolase